MSLLNQVLQDLEKRNVQNIPEQPSLNNIKASSPVPQTKWRYFVLLIIVFIIILALFVFNSKEPKVLSTQVSPSPALPKAKLQQKPVITTSKAIHKQSSKKVITVEKKVKPVIKKKQTTQPKATNNVKEPEKKSLTALLKSTKSSAKKVAEPLNNNQLAQSLFKSALKQHKLTEKQIKLQQVLKLNALHIDARLHLANTLLQQGLTKQAEIILKQGNLLVPQNIQLINLHSQLLLQQKKTDTALSILQQVDSNYIQDETYLGLLAAAYQQKNNFVKSIEIYQQLLSINAEKAEYWLGLAIAYENQTEKQKALYAYQQALNKNTLKTAIVSYIKQRISILK